MLTQTKRDAILIALRSGVSPEFGMEHIWVNRAPELSAYHRHLEHLTRGGSGVWFLIGATGTGKTAMQMMTKLQARRTKFVAASADMSAGRLRLAGTQGESVDLYRHIIASLSTASNPRGGSLGHVLDVAVDQLAGDATNVSSAIRAALAPLAANPLAGDFTTLVASYAEAHRTHDLGGKEAILRWFRAEVSRSEARKELGVRAIVSDEMYFDTLKLLAGLLRLGGFSGLVIWIDELSALTNEVTRQLSRAKNYDRLLGMINDLAQTPTPGLGLFFSGTEATLDTKRGLFSSESLQSRLTAPTIGTASDYDATLVRLAPIEKEHLFVLLQKVQTVFTWPNEERAVISDEGIKAFLAQQSRQLGADLFRDTRALVKNFVSLLSVLAETGKAWQEFVTPAAVGQDRA
jgi:hypothetical protein